MCVYVCVCMYVCMYVCMCVGMCVYVCRYVCMCACMCMTYIRVARRWAAHGIGFSPLSPFLYHYAATCKVACSLAPSRRYHLSAHFEEFLLTACWAVSYN